MRKKYKPKWYDDESWLRYMFFEKGATPSEIAAYAGIDTATAYRLLDKYGIKEI
jgi:hypothetical protein